MAPPAPTGLAKLDGDRADGEQVGHVASAQAPEAVQAPSTLIDAVASCPQPGGTHHVLRPYGPSLRKRAALDMFLYVNAGHPAAKLPVNSNDLHAVVMSRWGQDRPRTGFVYALCTEHGEPPPFVHDGGAQPSAQRFPQPSMPTVITLDRCGARMRVASGFSKTWMVLVQVRLHQNGIGTRRPIF